MIEEMSAFFTARVEGYDAHMLHDVEGCREGYCKMAALVPENAVNLLDLGCGTGLELDEIWKRHPDLQVTGIDMTRAMLDALRKKHPSRALNLICGSYFEVDFGTDIYDCAVSFQTLHHFTHEVKQGLYRRVCSALHDCGVYIECDYMAETQAEEDALFAENARLRKEQGIAADAFYHYDTPCTIENQMRLLKEAGFRQVEFLWRQENTTLLIAKK